MSDLRVLVTSHHPQRAMALRSAGLTVFEDDEVLDDPCSPLVAVLETALRDDVAITLTRWRVRRPQLPVVVLADETWPQLDGLDVTVMTPPVTAGDILRTIEDLLRADPTFVAPLPPSAVEAWSAEPSTEPVPFVALAASAPSAVPAVATVEDDRLPRSDSAMVKSLEPPVGAAEPTTERVPAPREGPTVRRRAGTSIVDAVTEAIGSYLPLPSVAEGICARLAVEPGGDVALLEERESGLHVLAGLGLRPLEWRDLGELPEAVARLAGRHRAMVVSDTDSLRSQVGMLPLGRHRSLLMARSPEPGHLLVVLGRERSYAKVDVRQVLGELDDQNDCVTAALRLRDAAVLLMPFAID